MLTEKDIQVLKKSLATKDDFNDFRKEFGEFKVENRKNFLQVTTREEFSQFKEEIGEHFSALRETTQALAVAVDKLVKAIDDLRQEYIAITSQINRHEKWIQQIAAKAGVKLEYF